MTRKLDEVNISWLFLYISSVDVLFFGCAVGEDPILWYSNRETSQVWERYDGLCQEKGKPVFSLSSYCVHDFIKCLTNARCLVEGNRNNSNRVWLILGNGNDSYIFCNRLNQRRGWTSFLNHPKYHWWEWFQVSVNKSNNTFQKHVKTVQLQTWNTTNHFCSPICMNA